jgi:hypothetical protein
MERKEADICFEKALPEILKFVQAHKRSNTLRMREQWIFHPVGSRFQYLLFNEDHKWVLSQYSYTPQDLSVHIRTQVLF